MARAQKSTVKRFAALMPGTMLVLLLSLTPGAAVADPALSEVKVGIHDHDVSILGHNKEDGFDISLEALFAEPKSLAFLFSPRPHIGAQVNSEDETSQIYGGLTWTLYPGADRLWVAFHFGGSFHNGNVGDSLEGKQLGSRLLFRLGAEVGVDVGQRHRLSILYDHESNATLADHNEGLNNIGLRYGFRF